MSTEGIYMDEPVMSWTDMFYSNLALLFEALMRQVPYIWRNRVSIFYSIVLGAILVGLYSANNYWQEFKRLQNVEQELYDTEEELERQRQINKTRVVRTEKDGKRKEAFQRVKDQIGCDENAWPVIVTNEVLALRAELTALRKAYDKQV
jgi:division protein CdvB (Snf7/Vps24/ESCRT-III family)